MPSFYTPPHDSGGVLWFHAGRPCVRPSVFSFRMITWVNINGFSPNLVCALIVEIWFEIANEQVLSNFTDLSDTKMAGYLTFWLETKWSSFFDKFLLQNLFVYMKNIGTTITICHYVLANRVLDLKCQTRNARASHQNASLHKWQSCLCSHFSSLLWFRLDFCYTFCFSFHRAMSIKKKTKKKKTTKKQQQQMTLCIMKFMQNSVLFLSVLLISVLFKSLKFPFRNGKSVIYLPVLERKTKKFVWAFKFALTDRKLN